MNWVLENHFTRIVHQERVARVSSPGRDLDLPQTLRKGLFNWRHKLAAGQATPQQRRSTSSTLESVKGRT